MAKCECLEKCLFFNDKMRNMPELADVYKKNYCRVDSKICARYIILKALGTESVPADLFPNQADRAKYLLMR
jgi:hypothetical protein